MIDSSLKVNLLPLFIAWGRGALNVDFKSEIQNKVLDQQHKTEDVQLSAKFTFL